MQTQWRLLLEREQEEINQMPDPDYKRMQKKATTYKKQLELQQQQEQHQRWAQLNAERQAHRKLSLVSSESCHMCFVHCVLRFNAVLCMVKDKALARHVDTESCQQISQGFVLALVICMLAFCVVAGQDQHVQGDAQGAQHVPGTPP